MIPQHLLTLTKHNSHNRDAYRPKPPAVVLKTPRSVPLAWPSLEEISVLTEDYSRCNLSLWLLGREYDPDITSEPFGLESVILLDPSLLP